MSKSKPTPRIDLVALKQAIIDHCDQLYMPTWMTGAGKISTLGECGTTLCVGGIACVLAGDTLHSGDKRDCVVTKDGETMTVYSRAMELLRPSSDRLFEWNNWPEPIRNDFRYALTSYGRASAACAAIDHFCRFA